jgi:hypothetical protein
MSSNCLACITFSSNSVLNPYLFAPDPHYIRFVQYFNNFLSKTIQLFKIIYRKHFKEVLIKMVGLHQKDTKNACTLKYAPNRGIL